MRRSLGVFKGRGLVLCLLQRVEKEKHVTSSLAK